MDYRIIQGLENVPDSLHGCVLTVGNFDGVHLGHQRILSVAGSLAKSVGVKLCVLTFDPPPAVVLAPDRAPDYIIPVDVKYHLLAGHGAEVIVVVAATREFLSGSAEQFVKDVLVGRLRPGHIVEGPNFFFGHDRSGTIETLLEMSNRFGFEVSVAEPVEIDLPGRRPAGRVRISSSLVRDLIRAGDVESAALCLGRPFTLYGTVVAGKGHGRILEFPTANVDPNGLISPGDGVYAAFVDLPAGKAGIDDVRYPSAVSVGTKPTFETQNVAWAPACRKARSRPCSADLDSRAGPCLPAGRRPCHKTIEAHLLDAAGDFYDKPIAVTFLARLRDQVAFPDMEALKAQIAKDVQHVRELCDKK